MIRCRCFIREERRILRQAAGELSSMPLNLKLFLLDLSSKSAILALIQCNSDSWIFKDIVTCRKAYRFALNAVDTVPKIIYSCLNRCKQVVIVTMWRIFQRNEHFSKHGIRQGLVVSDREFYYERMTYWVYLCSCIPRLW